MSKFLVSLAFFHTFRKSITAHQIIISPNPRDVYVCLKKQFGFMALQSLRRGLAQV